MTTKEASKKRLYSNQNDFLDAYGIKSGKTFEGVFQTESNSPAVSGSIYETGSKPCFLTQKFKDLSWKKRPTETTKFLREALYFKIQLKRL